MDETKYVLQIVETFTNSINGLNQTFGSLTALLGEIHRKLDNIPKEDFVLKLQDEWCDELKNHFENFEVDDKISILTNNINKHFTDLRRDLAKYEEFISTLKEQTIKSLCADLEKEKIKIETVKEDVKFNQQLKFTQEEHKHEINMFKNNAKLSLVLKILGGIGVLGTLIFQVLKKFYFGM